MNNKFFISIFYITYLLHFMVCDKTTFDNVEDSNDDEVEDKNQINRDEIAEDINSGGENNERITTDEDEKEERQKEEEAGDLADLFGTNQHYNIPVNYLDLGRRFVLSYPYFQKKSANVAAEIELENAVKEHLAAKKLSDKLVPVKAPPEFVLAIAKESAILEAAKPKNPTDDIIKKESLRTGEYWDDVWKEDIDPKRMLRTSNNHQNNLEAITVHISPGSKLYDLISMLKKKSPRLLYVTL